jgi:hypothetical protein
MFAIFGVIKPELRYYFTLRQSCRARLRGWEYAKNIVKFFILNKSQTSGEHFGSPPLALTHMI